MTALALIALLLAGPRDRIEARLAQVQSAALAGADSNLMATVSRYGRRAGIPARCSPGPARSGARWRPAC